MRQYIDNFIFNGPDLGPLMGTIIWQSTGEMTVEGTDKEARIF